MQHIVDIFYIFEFIIGPQINIWPTFSIINIALSLHPNCDITIYLHTNILPTFPLRLTRFLDCFEILKAGQDLLYSGSSTSSCPEILFEDERNIIINKITISYVNKPTLNSIRESLAQFNHIGIFVSFLKLFPSIG